MSTISNERIEQIMTRCVPFHGECAAPVSVIEVKAMAHELLALRKERERAEPVAWTEKCEITNMQATGLYLRGFPDSSQGRDIPLYTAPPAPPVADDSLPYDPQIAEYEQMMEAEQAQADTTAQQFESLEGKAVGGWIPCSERMPETYVNVLLTDEYGDTCIGQLESCDDANFYISCSTHRYKATHWQPLPEPPCK
ncbi:DUF551 domain-containing protein [Cronobacter dublinensis]